MIEVPCGDCSGCRLDHAADWAGRCAMECKNWKNNFFVTFTYDNDHLPHTSDGRRTLKKKDFSNFMKRLRKATDGAEEWTNPITEKREKIIRFFACGEYGSKRGRPHYHAALFNLAIPDLKFYKENMHGDKLYTSEWLSKIWGQGFVIIGFLNYESASYIARYCQKKSYYKKSDEFWDKKWYKRWVWVDEHGRTTNEKNGVKQVKRLIRKDEKEEEFINMSRAVGLGRMHWEKVKESIIKNTCGRISIKTKKGIKHIKISRYFKKCWEKEDWESLEKYKYKEKLQAEENKKKILAETDYGEDSEEKNWATYLKTQEEIHNSRIRFLKRENMI
ncbi:replication initiator protein [Dipodfec virus UA23Rod_1071]|uniref:Replication initiator protein n=1 Tax=Dipodfec virus UA23Rod_1071 TaxID=2929326 RepID=A0A976N1T9_9VIRU|nr:replication initiator protein [Dipodfec virus UA23Rod_1071]